MANKFTVSFSFIPNKDKKISVDKYKQVRDLSKVALNLKRLYHTSHDSDISTAFQYSQRVIRKFRDEMKKKAIANTKTVELKWELDRKTAALDKHYGYLKNQVVNFRDYKTASDNIKNTKEALKLLRSQVKAIRFKSKSVNIGGGASHRYNLQAGVHSEPGAILQMMKAKESKLVYTSKSPRDDKNYVGIELEFFCKWDKSKLATALFEAGVAKNVCLKSDGSIQSDKSGYETHELAILATEDTYRDVVNTICNVLGQADARVNKSCGMHVHLDMRNRDKDLVFSNLVSAQSILYAMNPKSREEGTYCKRTTAKKMDKVSGRYWGINPAAYGKFRTLEVRIHAGTVSAIKVINWIDLLLNVASLGTEVKRAPTSVKGFIKAYKIKSNLAQYIIDRIMKFNPESGEQVAPESEAA